MINEFVELFMASKEKLREQFSKNPPLEYRDIVKVVISIFEDEEPSDAFPDPDRIHEIDDGEWQGTLIYVIGAHGYQPYDYWYARIAYGSCSVCDTLEGIHDLDDGTEDYLTLALHIVQNLKKMGGEEC